MTPEERIEKALEIASRYGDTDGSHHKAWAIDQMVRALTDCPMVADMAIDATGQPYTYDRQGESDAYRAWVADHRAGEDGPETYEWDEGIPP